MTVKLRRSKKHQVWWIIYNFHPQAHMSAKIHGITFLPSWFLGFHRWAWCLDSARLQSIIRRGRSIQYALKMPAHVRHSQFEVGALKLSRPQPRYLVERQTRLRRKTSLNCIGTPCCHCILKMEVVSKCFFFLKIHHDSKRASVQC